MKHTTIEYDPITGAKRVEFEIPETPVESDLAVKAANAARMTQKVRNARNKYLRGLSNTKKK